MPAPDRWRRLIDSRVLRVLGVILALAALYGVPRVIALRGVEHTSYLHFTDMFFHLNRMDIQNRRVDLPVRLMEDLALQRAPRLIQTEKLMRWPEGTYRVGRPLMRIFGPKSIWTVLLTNLLFTVIMVMGVIALGDMLGSRRAGIWGAALTLLCPALVAHSWYFSLDYPLIGMVLVGLYFLWRTRGYSDWRWCLALALWSILGLHIKITYVLYLVAPGAAALVVGLRGGRGRARVLLHLLGAAALTLLASLWLNGWTLPGIWTELSQHAVVAPGEEEAFPCKLLEPWTLRWALSMPLFIISNFPWPLLLLAVPGLVLIHLRGAPAARWVLLSFFWSTLIFLTLITNKMERYLQPVYPALCLFTAWFVLTKIPRRWQRVAMIWTAVSFLCVLGLTQIRKTPWFVDRHAAVEERCMHELEMPNGHVLGNLRRHGYHHFCSLGPLFGEVEAMVRGRTSRPLGFDVQITNRQIDIRTFSLVLSLAHRNRDQLWLYDDSQIPDPKINPFLSLPTLVVLHSPDVNLSKMYPSLKVLTGKSVRVLCEKYVSLRLTMLEPRSTPRGREE